MRIINFGSLNLDYTYSVDHIVEPGETLDTGERKIFCGGKGLNQSIALARAGLEVHHAGMIGEDGEMLVDLCRKENIHTHYIWKVPGPSGHTIIQVDAHGQNSILLYGGANRKFTKNYIDEVLADFNEEDIVLLQNEINLPDYVIEAAARKKMRIILNPSPYNDQLKSCDLGKVNLFLINEIEGMQMTGEEDLSAVLDALTARYQKAGIVMTLGGDGCVYQDASRRFYQDSFRVPVKDTTGAGDTFTGYFIAGLVSGMDVRECLMVASRAAAIAVTRPGASSSIPTKQEVRDIDLEFERPKEKETKSES